MQRSLPAFDPVDVVVVAWRDCAGVLDCVKSVLHHKGRVLGRLLVLNGSGETGVVDELGVLGELANRVETVAASLGLSFGALVNLGLGESRSDTVLLSAGCRVEAGWLEELRAAAWLEERTICVSPVLLDRPRGAAVERGPLEQRGSGALAIGDACASLPRTTTIPVVEPWCVYFKRALRLAVGALDEAFDSPETVLADWTMRAQRLGFMAKRANRVVVVRAAGERVSWSAGAEDQGEIARRHPQLAAQVKRFRGSFEDRLAEHAVRLAAGEPIRLALDMRHMPPHRVGTRTLAVCLTEALAQRPDIDLTVLIREPRHSSGLPGRIVHERNWADDVQVIHRPAQVTEARDLELQLRSSAHIVNTYLDLIGYRTPLVWPCDQEYELFRATSALSVATAQCVVAMSENVAGELVAEFGLDPEDVRIVPLGVEAERFAAKKPNDGAILRGLHTPERYFLSVATDYHHKNLDTLMRAHDLLQKRLGDQTPSLLLAGNRHGGRSAFYPDSRSRGAHVHFLGSVTDEQLRVLYQNATALVYPSLYEGFGLPPLEAMAAGAPVIAMPISCIPEVSGPAALYPEDLSAESLCRALERLATDEGLREQLVARGRAHVARYRWDRMAEQMVEVYRSVILYPSQRSLEQRRRLTDAAIIWSRKWAPTTWDPAIASSAFAASAATEASVIPAAPPSIRASWYHLQLALRNRIKRELRRLPLLKPGFRVPERTIPVPKFRALIQSRQAHRHEGSVRGRESA